MKYFGLALELKNDPSVIDTYKEYHRNVWPEVEEQLRGIGVVQMRIFLLGTRMFMYLETTDAFDPATSWHETLTNPRYHEWDTLMRPLQQVVPEAKPGEWWAMMDPVYVLNRSEAAGGNRR